MNTHRLKQALPPLGLLVIVPPTGSSVKLVTPAILSARAFAKAI